jgi:hypothetical protein
MLAAFDRVRFDCDQARSGAVEIEIALVTRAPCAGSRRAPSYHGSETLPLMTLNVRS